MNTNWKAVFKILEKEQRIIIGLMSGTSLDGLDIALCAVTGNGVNTKLKVLNFTTVEYASAFKKDIRSVFSRPEADLQMISLMNERVGLLHAEMILTALDEWGVKTAEVDVVASHGQTIFHAPRSLHGIEDYPNATLQIGDGDHIAVKTGILTISDFRQKHIAAGGEGAPLAVYGDYLLFSKPGEVRIMLNIGGIANFTYLPGDADATTMFSTDVGPGNTIMDQFIQKNYEGLYYDNDGDLAGKGEIHQGLLTALLDLEFFSLSFPKTTGPELFNLKYLDMARSKSDTTTIAPDDVLATLNRFSACAISEAIKKCTAADQKITVYMSGGGIHNKTLIAHLITELPTVRFATTDELGIDPDAKEAVLFALLANETLVGEPLIYGNGAGLLAVCMGKICLPH